MGGNDELYSDNRAGMTLDGGDGNDTLSGGNYVGVIFIGGAGDDEYYIEKGYQDIIKKIR
ncbi:MAG: hypothetical protein ACO1PM_16890 [Acidovorax sp.]